ncbi:unnamed protein product [Notodromas monacha]|uniref:UPF3 domain-containing protein n=1 Tax=Notodromas monacha TaxID=399045 RepID=A0A7R9GH81_9CRUS|nr:unnamed protein product [Notodromas monacha]CAG0921196.1 unnamed protein product [Notodromas monacha]
MVVENGLKASDEVSRSSRHGVAARRTQTAVKTKVVIRRLPHSMSEAEFLDAVGPLGPHDYFYFVEGSSKQGPFGYARAYINFVDINDLAEFGQKFDNYVFVDASGTEYPAVVEYAPSQRIPRKQPRPVAGGATVGGETEKPGKAKSEVVGTYESDPMFQAFLEKLNAEPETIPLPTPEDLLAEIEARDKELKASNGVPIVITPLIERVMELQAEKGRWRDEKREERKRKEQEKKRLREEERRRKTKDHHPHSHRDREKTDTGHGKSVSSRVRHNSRDADEPRRPPPRNNANKPALRKNKLEEKRSDESIPSIKLLRKPSVAVDGEEDGSYDGGNSQQPSSKRTANSSSSSSLTSVKRDDEREERMVVKSAVFSSKTGKRSSTKSYRFDDGGDQPSSAATGKQRRSRDPDEPGGKSEKDEDSKARREREKRRNRDRPAMEIYRPPPRRSGQSDAAAEPDGEQHERPPREHSPEDGARGSKPVQKSMTFRRNHE